LLLNRRSIGRAIYVTWWKIKETKKIKDQATYNLIQGKTEPTIEEAITAALACEDARPPMRITRDMNNNEYRLEMQRNTNFSTGDTFLLKVYKY